jgi:RNA polymerase sigma-70 factor (ECF subfamily)
MLALEAKITPRDLPSSPSHDRRETTDEALLAALERRENWAAAALFDRLENVVERSLYRILQQRSSDFEDLVQVTFERIVRTLVDRRFAAQCSLSTWASAIASNVAIDAVRARIRERKMFAGEPLDSADNHHSSRQSGTDRLEHRAELLRIQRVLSQMNQGQAEALYLHDVLGHDLTEIAEITGVSVAAAQSRLVRGRKEFLRRAKRDPLGGPTS